VKPVRIQRKRTKGFNLQAASISINGLFAISVTRPGKHGNPYYPGCGIGRGIIGTDNIARAFDNENPEHCVHMFKLHIRDMKRDQPDRYEALLAPLRGKNLACWCALDQPCHADVLLEIANA